MPASMLRLGGALPALRRATPVRVMSSAPAAFDGELSMLYTKIFEQHAHQRGPWKKMLAAVREAVPPGQQAAILDLATGPGEPATTIARELPEATVWATDVSGDMLAKAQTRMAGLPNARFAKLDMQDLSQFDDATFDVVTVCYGFMFTRDKPQSVRESHRVLKPGGRLIATYWTEMAMLKLLQQTMAGVLGGVPPPFEIDPLCLAPEGLFHSMLKDAGFATTEYSVGAYPFDLGTDPDTQVRATPPPVFPAPALAHAGSAAKRWVYCGRASEGGHHAQPNPWHAVALVGVQQDVSCRHRGWAGRARNAHGLSRHGVHAPARIAPSPSASRLPLDPFHPPHPVPLTRHMHPRSPRGSYPTPLPHPLAVSQYMLGTMLAKEKLDSIPSGHAKAKPIFLSRLNDYLWDPDIDRKRQPGGVPDPGAGVKVGPNRFVLAVATKAA